MKCRSALEILVDAQLFIVGARGQFDEEELFEAGRRMLQANLEETWIGAGQNIRAATWLKIVYWHHDESMTPLQVILKAYDNMPNVIRPDFV